MANTFPEIERMNLRDAQLALRLATIAFDSVKPGARPGLLARMEALETRIDRLSRNGGR